MIAPAVRPAALAAVMVGGALGSAARFALWSTAPTEPGALRISAITAVVGCAVLGVLLGVSARVEVPLLREFSIGLCGGFASFSVFAVLAVAVPTAWNGVAYLAVVPLVALASMAAAWHLTSTMGRSGPGRRGWIR